MALFKPWHHNIVHAQSYQREYYYSYLSETYAFDVLQLTWRIITFRNIKIPIWTPRIHRQSSVHQYPDLSESIMVFVRKSYSLGVFKACRYTLHENQLVCDQIKSLYWFLLDQISDLKMNIPDPDIKVFKKHGIRYLKRLGYTASR